MESSTDNTPLIVIVGPTASGKTALALQLTQQYQGAIIAADSRTIYKEMDIGTAKPTTLEQQLVPHYGIDLITPDTNFSVAEFQKYARQAIAEIAKRGRIPFLVGGSGLYVDSVVFDFDFRRAPDPAERRELQKLPVEELQARVNEAGYKLPENKSNPRHLIRILETRGDLSPRNTILRPNSLVIGILADSTRLRPKIEQRVESMIAAGFVEEVRMLGEKYGWDAPGLQAPGYGAFRQYLQGDVSLTQARERLIQKHLQYAKRQRTWFKRNKSIHWVNNRQDIEDLITTFLSK